MKNYFSCLLLFVISAVLLAGCGIRFEKAPNLSGPDNTAAASTVGTAPSADATAQDAQGEFLIPAVTDYRACYSNVLDSFYDIITSTAENYDIVPGGIGAWEASAWQESEQALASTGYLIRDINHDGIPELMVGDIPHLTEDVTPYTGGSAIYALYTLKDREPVCILEGWARNRLYLLEDGMILNEGSGGAAYSILATYTLPSNAAEAVCKDYYFTHETDETFSEIAVYHNTIPAWVVSVSEKLDMTAEDLWNLEAELAAHAISLPFTPFAEYPLADTGSLVARFAASDTDLSHFTRIVLDDGSSRCDLLLSAYGSVQDFTVLSIKFVETADGFAYSGKELYRYGTLSSDTPVILSLTFFGDMPSYAISYKDSTGQTHYYSISLSGKDGSLQLTEI